MAQPPVILQDILTILDRFAPFTLAESWDNVGLMWGSPAQEVEAVLLGLDPTCDLLDEAVEQGANLVINHHPLIFHPLKSVRPDQPLGACLAAAVRRDIALVACHTNLDSAAKGVSQVLAKRLGLDDIGPLRPRSAAEADLGFGALGTLREPMGQQDFLAHICRVMELDGIKVCGTLPERLSRVALCGGSGSDLAYGAYEAGAQVYITGEVKHDVARWAEEAGLCIIDAGHFATENLMMAALAAYLSDKLIERGTPLPVYTSKRQKSPFVHYMANK